MFWYCAAKNEEAIVVLEVGCFCTKLDVSPKSEIHCFNGG